MLSIEEKSRLNEKISILQREINELKTKLNKINEEKEGWFKKKEALKSHIKEFIEKIKEIKVQGDKGYESIKSLKEQRDKYNSEVKNLIYKVKELNNEKVVAFKRYKLDIDPNGIQSKIDDIERRLEVEVSFENEKKLVKELKRLKRANEEASEIKKILDSIKKLSAEIKESKKKADEFHSKIIESSKQKNSSYTDFIDLSRKINELRKDEEEAFQKFISYKKEFSSTNKIVKERIAELSNLKSQLGKDREQQHLKREETLKEKLIERTKEVWEKFRSKKKLTTEDLIVLQGKEK